MEKWLRNAIETHTCDGAYELLKFFNCVVYFPDDNSEKYPGILYPGDTTVYRVVPKQTF